jgi:hypothetical protein
LKLSTAYFKAVDSSRSGLVQRNYSAVSIDREMMSIDGLNASFRQAVTPVIFESPLPDTGEL